MAGLSADDFQEGAAAPSDKMEALKKEIDQLLALEETVENLEADLKAAKLGLNNLKTRVVPQLMDEVGLAAGVFGGWSVVVSDFVSGSLPKDEQKRDAALRWLKDQGAEGLIRTQLEVHFGASEHAQALAVCARLEEEGLSVSLDAGVNSQSLAAFARERLRNGEPLDTEVLGLYVGRIVKVKRAS